MSDKFAQLILEGKTYTFPAYEGPYGDKAIDISTLLDIAKELEDRVRNDDYFVSRNLYPNVDFFSGIIYRAMGIPTNMFTVMFALGRLPGWLANWREMMGNTESRRIGRPRQLYTGHTRRPFIPLSKRP